MENNKTGFVERLKHELSTWKYEGWVSARGGSKILAHYGINEKLDTERNPAYAQKWFIVVGIALIGLGVLIGTGSEGQSLPRTIKMFYIFIGLIIAYGLGFYFSFVKKDEPIISELITTAAALFYGYALWSFNSLVNVHADSSTIFLLWAICIILLAIILKSEYILSAAILGFTAWTAACSAQYMTPNYYFLIVAVVVLLPVIYWLKSTAGLLLLVTGLSIWLGMALNAYSTSVQIFLPVVFVLWGILLYHLAYLHRKIKRFDNFYLPLQISAIILIFVGLSLLALRTLGLVQARFFTDHEAWFFKDGLPILIFSIVIAVGIIGTAIVSMVNKQKERSMSRVEFWLLDIIGLVMFIYLLFPEAIPDELKKSLLTGYFLVYTTIFNMVLFLFIGVILWTGINARAAWLLNLGIVFIAITAMARYFDTFLPTLPGNIFLFIGGFALLISGICMKKK